MSGKPLGALLGLLVGVCAVAGPAVPGAPIAASPPEAPLPPPTPPPLPPGLGLEAAAAPERIAWDRTPIAVTLAVGSERQVRFPKPVKVGIPVTLQQLLRTQTVAGTVYWQAHRAFEATRVLVRETEGGRTYLLDVRAVEGAGAAAPVEVTDPEALTGEARALEAAETEPSPPAEIPAPGPVALTRVAAQELYAPVRLLQALPGVTRVPLRTSRKVALLRGARVEARPIAAWRSRDYYVTAVRLQNLTSSPIVLDPRDVRGTWIAATFQHARLLPAGSAADVTCLYLVSARSFEESL